ncbi:MAG TPA: hypothetical protein VFH80_22055 [Solirubrobacteraceae bacterium]|nr:hypothetical protein [Solirubrobacteraceae bacterium]
MSPATYQTIKLSKGKHASPEDGACVMELASMLAGEPFTDHPASVCPVIGSFLRSYNDTIDERRRQSLYEYASRVVGSRGGQRVQEERAERLARWADEILRTRRTWFLRSPVRALTRLRKPPIDAIGPYAVHAIRKHSEQTHEAVLALVDELLAIGVRDDRVSARVIAARTRALDTAV